MWMDECNDRGKDLRMLNDPTHGRKLRHLMPRSCSSNGGIQSDTFSTVTAPSCCCFQNPNIHSWNYPLISSAIGDYGVKREMNMTVPLVSSRWNPTPEQLQALEEMYRRGLRNPTAEQIQQIAAKLKRFGKIEGKNVFYWFQNHKARERQKKRRQLELLATGKKRPHVESLGREPTGLDRRAFEIGHPKKLPTLSNCSTHSEDSVSMHRAVIAERRKDEWIQLNQKELRQEIITTEKNEKCWPMELSSYMPPYNSNSTVGKTTAERGLGRENTKPFGAPCLSMLWSPRNDYMRILGNRIKENQTLQLFPVRSNDLVTLHGIEQDESRQDVSATPSIYAPNKFIEFLPTKC